MNANQTAAPRRAGGKKSPKRREEIHRFDALKTLRGQRGRSFNEATSLGTGGGAARRDDDGGAAARDSDQDGSGGSDPARHREVRLVLMMNSGLWRRAPCSLSTAFLQAAPGCSLRTANSSSGTSAGRRSLVDSTSTCNNNNNNNINNNINNNNNNNINNNNNNVPGGSGSLGPGS
ncbi:hypothetical protein EYF80_046899 [Liparis tanakae]|uniref:Uncharacterized protein n=1 Tax=Liparis tanakae TaxID=230148 RepID=A0A4Z2FNT1_9TELE|nr:hypothetical protein EYF80_046899 [Liparis tanakae]